MFLSLHVTVHANCLDAKPAWGRRQWSKLPAALLECVVASAVSIEPGSSVSSLQLTNIPLDLTAPGSPTFASFPALHTIVANILIQSLVYKL
ncbi:hypothetical protein GE21DRAFT_1278322 [Neurospora crassa]|nr:hypothetical protein GE21DRAFT_1278322 [Neurospora crassa]